MFNISVDTADPNPDSIPEDSSINDQESIFEIVLEKILGFEDAVKEYDDHDTEDNIKKKNIEIVLSIHVINSKNHDNDQVIERSELYPDYSARLTNGFKEIDSPPPQV